MHSIELVSLSSGTYRSLAEEYIFVSRETVSDNRVEEVYEHNGEQFRLIAEFVNGKKHGKSELVCNANHRVASLTYVDGKLTGPCILWNTAKRIVFEGHLQDGAKDGICREFDDHGHVLFHGVYTNGEKKLFYELIEKGALKGYFYEKTLEDEILSICQFNGNSLNKHGRCLEFRSGSLVSEKYYNHGVVHYERLRIDGDTMTELDEDGNVVYEGGYMYLGEGTFLRHYRGVEYRGSGVRSYEGGFNEGYYHGQGCLYNLNDLSSNPPLFEGEWCYGYPEGMGTLYDPKDNEVRIKGKWHLGVLNGMDYASGGRQSPCSSLFHARPYHVQSRKYHRRVMICPALHFAIAHQLHQLVIASHSMNNCVEDGSLVELRLDGFPHLKKMEIGSHSFRFVNCIVLEKLPSLESVTIGSHCCCCCCSSAAAKWSDESSYESMDGQKTNDQGCFRIVHCSHLLEIEICDESCRSFCQFELSDCPSLQFIDIGKNCFQYADCYLRDLPGLEMAIFAERSFVHCHSVVFENLPKFRRLIFYGDAVFQGDAQETRKVVINGFDSYDNSLTMRNLPSLTSIECFGDYDNIHCYIGRVLLENIPRLTEKTIDYGDGAFFSTADLQATNAQALGQFIDNQVKFITIEMPF